MRRKEEMSGMERNFKHDCNVAILKAVVKLVTFAAVVSGVTYIMVNVVR